MGNKKSSPNSDSDSDSEKVWILRLDKNTGKMKKVSYDKPNLRPQPVPSEYFDQKSQKWTKCKGEVRPIKDVKQLKLLTYNLLLSKFKFEQRIAYFWKIVQESDPDFICFQEFTEVYWNALKESAWAKNYYVSVVPIQKHFTIMLSKYPVQFYLTEFISHQGRYILFAESSINAEKTAVMCVHLESRFHDYDYRTH